MDLWGSEPIVLKRYLYLEKEFWNELPEEFMTIYKDQFSLVKKEKNGYRIYSEIEQSISEEELLKHSQNLVMLFENIDNKQLSKKSAINNDVFYSFYWVFMLFLIFF
ncbi:hypothetical protein FNJ88_08435 [Chryseobacterium sp. SNU WT5]|uniref:hypothetical protein n=1 Tax=Chryseobacterium sp. SNU WT5 TaxID=2594269 RepID=UPI00117DD713|nr:hypothetical protein [Chryseobacterium sp. SNU WT5]QDP85588.1 hypothetical protein FNJ88_08435 [Chryseobacterium sp. SNU WT5]